MKIIVDNSNFLLLPRDEDEEDQIKDFVESTSFFVEGAYLDPRFKSKRWDGYERLVAYKTKMGRAGKWTAPIGLLHQALMTFDDIEITDSRREIGAEINLVLDPEVIPNLRDYQRKAVKKATMDRGVRTGKGLLRLPIRSGKTVIAAAIICELGLRSIFVVNSDMLLRQTVEFFKKAIKAENYSEEMPLVAQWGGGEKELGWITVASVQSISRGELAPEMDQLLLDVDVAFFDEAHHLSAESWRNAMMKCDARYKIGLSATIYLSKTATALGTIWLVGATGPVLYTLSPSDLIAMGWLNTPKITFLTAPSPKKPIKLTSKFAVQYRDAIVQNKARNMMIAAVAKKCLNDGWRPLITVSRIEHAKLIEVEIKKLGLSVATVFGSTKADSRRALCDSVKNRKIDVLLGTVFGEAVDLPFLEAVIIADGMSSMVLTMQRLRNLTPIDSNDKTRHSPLEEPHVVPVYEFADFSTPMMARHALARLQAYKEHPRFIVEWDGEVPEFEDDETPEPAKKPRRKK